MYIAAGQGQTTPGDKILMSTLTSCRFGHLLQVSKNLFKSWFIQFFFMILYMYIAPRQGLTTPWGQIFYVNRNIFGHLLQVSKKSLWSLILYNFFHDFIHVYSLRAEADSPQGTKFWCQQKCLVTSFICCKFQKYVFEVWFYTIFFMINYMYIAPGQGQTDPGDKILMSTERPYHFTHLLQVSKKSLYPQGSPQGTKFWCQQKLLVNSVICC